MKKIGLLLTVLLVIILSFTSCNAAHNDFSAPSAADKGNYGAGAESGGGIGVIPEGSADNPAAKIIKIADANVKTLDYEGFIDNVYAKISELGGYTDGESFRGSAPSRSATVTVRVPADKLDEFKNALGDIGTLTYYSTRKLDVSLEYATLSARIETLVLEIGVVEELFEIAKEQSNLASITELEGRLSALKLELAEARAAIAVYDNSIAYSTVNLTVNEYAEEIEEETEVEKGAFERIGENFVNNLKNIGNFFVELFVFLVSALPYLILLGGIGVGITFIVLKINRKNKK